MKLRLRAFILLLFVASSLCANDRYWVGGSGNWNDVSHWASEANGRPAGIPTLSDKVFLGQQENGIPADTILIDGIANCGELIFGLYDEVEKLVVYAPVVLTGNGIININGSLRFYAQFSDQFTGTWNFTDPISDLRDNSIAEIKTSGHVFTGKVVFTAPASGSTTNNFQIVDELYVNNTLEIHKGVTLNLPENAKIAALTLRDFSKSDGLSFNTTNNVIFSKDGNSSQRNIDPQSPQSHTVTVIIVPNLCNGQCTATATAVVTGGSGSFSYQWSNTQTTVTATGLCAGTYLVVVTDLVNGDQVPAFAIVTDPPPLIIFFVTVSPLCNGSCNGSSSASVAGGTSPYVYLWTPGNQTTSSISGQCAGTYTLTVTDVNGCTVTQNSLITQPAPLLPVGTRTNVTCNGACNGIATVNPTGGTGPYTYNWVPGNITTQSLSNLCPGSYTCTVTDSHNCTSTYTAVITQPAVLNITMQHTNTSCNASCNGTATSTVTGGTSPYSYLWLPGLQITPNITGQCAGTYTLNVTDANGCLATTQVTITEPTPLVVAPTGVNITCFAACNGTASANASGGTPGYTYSWLPSGGTAATASGLCPGTYTVNVTDANGCTGSGQVIITQPLQLFPFATRTNVTCFGACDGTATCNPVGGTAPYTYVWQPGNIASQSLSNLCPGSYSLTVTDANNCISTATVTITQPPILLSGGTFTNVTCNGACNGTATANPSGGTGPYTYNWMPGNLSTQTISNLCPGTYTLTVTDANGCIRTQNITIIEPNPLLVTINATQITCNSSCNGTAAAVVSGGTATYTYLWTPGNFTTASISNLCANTYNLQVTDANGCVTNASVVLNQPTALSLVQGVTNTTCNGSCNGDAAVIPSGGNGPYTYLWAPGGQTTPFINGLCAGSYTVTVTDANNCSDTATLTVTQPPALLANVTSNNVSCNGGCNGSAISNPSGGTAPYTFLWSIGAQTTANVSGLCPGTYVCTVTDANGCSVNQQVTITQPSALLAVVAATTSACGNCNGTATVAASGGTAPYAYFWTPVGGTNPTATGLCIGNYTVTVTDAAGCVTTATCTVNPIVNIIVTSSTNTLSCFGACDGIASVNASGGTNPYTYNWAPIGQFTQTVTNLCAGSYTCTATDANGCFNTATVTFIDPPQLLSTQTNTNVSCNGVCDATASVTPSGGTGAYSYSWAPGGQTTASVNGLCAGTYTATVSDANGCSVALTITITEPTLVVANAIVANANCTLCDGSITANPSGGTGPYTYSWAPGGQTTAAISSLCPGIYTVTITDATNCAVVIPIAVSNISGPTIQATSTNVTCNAGCNGTATATVTAGNGPYTYDWTPGNPLGDGTASVTGLCSGTWFCQVTDAVGCITFATYIITQPAAITVSATVQNVSCGGNADGVLTATPSGGVGPYTYLWAPGGQTTASINGLIAGVYTVTVTDANGCTTTQQYTITEPLLLTSTISFTNVLCNAACNGTAALTVSGGTAPYFYLWSSGQGTASVANLCPGTYTVDITDANGCTIQQQVTITEPTPLITSLASVNASCNGVCDGSGTVTASGGVGGYTYTWSPGGGTTPTASGLCAGAYSVITLDANGCSSVTSTTILEPSAIVLSASSGPLSCFGNCNGVASVTASGGTPGYTYSWAPSGGTAATELNLCAGIYTVTVTDANGCSQNVSTTVNQPALLQANTSFTSPSCGNSCNGTATANPVGGTSPYSYLWAPGGQTTATITNQCAGSYTVTVRDANNCQDVQIVNVVAAASMNLVVASAPANCGACDGTINVTPVNGTSPYTYAWTGGLPPIANQVGVCAGIYTVTVTDATGCVSSFTITLNNSGGPTGETVVSTDVTCPGGCNGSAIVNPIGGTSPYTYFWNPGGQTVNNLVGMCGGNYFLQVTDSNGCIRFSPVIINEPLPIVAAPFVANATCTGICDGSVSLNTSGGTGPYTYLWAPGGQTTSTISGLCVGGYTVTITDVNGCTQTSTSNVNPWNTLSAVITSSDPTCASSCNGNATATITAGTAPFTYLWTDPLGQNAATASGLCAGNYSVMIADASGCNTSLPVVLNGPTPILIAPILTPTTCGQCNGTATLNVSGGTSPYTYVWSNAATTSTVNGMCAGVYTVIVSDATGCSATFTITISSSGGPTAANGTVVNTSCNGICDGSISLAPTGGILPYTYNWLPTGQTTSSINGLCAGTYIAQIQDSAGCILTQSFAVTSPAAIVPNQIITNSPCGACSGNITLNTTGGTGPYTYLWAPGGQTTSIISNLCAGLYTVTITDAIGCTQTTTIPVSSSNSGMTLTATSTNVLCNGNCNGSAIVSVVGGTSPYTYTWSNSATNDTINGLCPGNYLVQAIDAGGCVNTTAVTITQPNPLAGSIPFVQNELCTGACNGFITSIISGGTFPYAYVWTPTAQITATATNLCSGIYSVTITDNNGCTLTQSDTIVSPVVLILGAPVVLDASCLTSPDGSINITISGGALPYVFTWTGPNSYSANTEDVSGLLPGSYTINIVDANGCSIADTMVVGAQISVIADAGNDTTFCQSGNITLDGSGSTNGTSYQWLQLPGNTVVGNTQVSIVNPPAGTTAFVLIATNGACTSSDTVFITSSPLPIANAGPDQEIIMGMTTTIGGTPTGPVGTTFIWSPSTGLGDPFASNPVSSPLGTTTYIVYVTDANGCTGSDTMELVVVPAIDFPNGFSPNQDGINDYWQIDNIQLFPNCQVEVYNRWGELLFNSTGYNPPWDGRFDGKDLPVGTYYYIIKLNDPLFPDVYTGPITILR